jgi:hypothetical protein
MTNLTKSALALCPPEAIATLKKLCDTLLPKLMTSEVRVKI